MKIGDFEVKFKEFKPFEVLPFLPFFQRFVSTTASTRPDLRKKLGKLLEQLDKKPNDEKLLEEISNVSNLINSETETATMILFEHFNEEEWRRIKKFIVNHIEEWNLQTKNEDGEYVIADITIDNFDKLPMFYMPTVLTEVATSVLMNGEDINFSIPSSDKEPQNTKGNQKGKKKTK